MPKSKRPRKAYQPKDWNAEAQRMREDDVRSRAEQAGESQSAEQAHSVPIDKEPPAPAHPHVVHPSSPRAPRGGGRYLVPVAAGAGIIGGGAFLAHRSRRKKAEMAKGLIDPTTGESVSYERVYIDDTVDKVHAEQTRGVLVAKDDKGPSAGRRVTGGLLPGYHGLAAGKKGKKARAYGNEALGATAGGVAVHLATRGKLLRASNAKVVEGLTEGIHRMGESGNPLSMYRGVGRAMRSKEYLRAAGAGVAGSTAGAQLGINRNQRKGYYKPQAGTKSARYDESAVEHTGSRRGHGHPVSTVRVPGLPVSSASFSRGNPEARPGTRSHANKVTHVHTKVKASRTGKLFALHHKARSRSGSSVGKSAGFAQSAGSGRRLVNI